MILICIHEFKPKGPNGNKNYSHLPEKYQIKSEFPILLDTAMLIIYLISPSTLLISEKPLRELRVVHRNLEQLDAVADRINLEQKIERICKQYRISSIERDYKLPRKKWKLSASTKQKMSAHAKTRKWSDDVKERISQSMKGKRNHRITHSSDSKMLISDSMKGNDNAKGLKWCYDPITLKEYRVAEVPYGMVAGRTNKHGLKQFA